VGVESVEDLVSVPRRVIEEGQERMRNGKVVERWCRLGGSWRSGRLGVWYWYSKGGKRCRLLMLLKI
jgi:hypothetical protein